MKFQKLFNSGESETTDKGEQQPELRLESRLAAKVLILLTKMMQERPNLRLD